jgi:hypothetical protein
VCVCVCDEASPEYYRLYVLLHSRDKAPIIFVTSVSPSADISTASTGRMSVKFHENKFRNFKFG